MLQNLVSLILKPRFTMLNVKKEAKQGKFMLPLM